MTTPVDELRMLGEKLTRLDEKIDFVRKELGEFGERLDAHFAKTQAMILSIARGEYREDT